VFKDRLTAEVMSSSRRAMTVAIEMPQLLVILQESTGQARGEWSGFNQCGRAVDSCRSIHESVTRAKCAEACLNVGRVQLRQSVKTRFN